MKQTIKSKKRQDFNAKIGYIVIKGRKEKADRGGSLN